MAVAKERVSTATDYVVLARRELKDPDSDEIVVAWVESGHESATARVDAAKKVAGDTEGDWRPVPVRNWSPIVRTTTETTKSTKVEVIED
jgi:hypothetical protein